MTGESPRRTDEEWVEQLTPDQFRICRLGETERAFTGAYWDCDDPGTYLCVCCGKPLFDSDSKFDAGCGWPSYTRPIQADAIVNLPDHSHGMIRTEVRCAGCDAHLGHVFEDGPAPTGLRYCINSASLRFQAPG